MFKQRLEDVAIVLNPKLDQVALAKKDIPLGSVLEAKDSSIKIRNFVRKGQRFALRDIKEGEAVRQYGYPFAQSRGILKSEVISVANIKNAIPWPEADLANYTSPDKTRFKKEYLNKKFLGYKRKNNKAGTRNYYLVMPTSMCASETALQIALTLDGQQETLRKYKNIDGIVAIPHSEGCGCDSGLQIERLMRVLKGYLIHPNVGGCLLIDLGCEQTNYEKLYPYFREVIAQDLKPVDWLTIQQSGGTRQTIEKAKRIIRQRLHTVNRAKRQPCPMAGLVVATECGASDSFSGITANPVIGNTVDKVIYGAGTAILSEIPEMLGTWEMLLPRFRNLATAHKFQAILDWYIEIAKKQGLSLEPNLVPKNIEAGLVNNYIKSLGAVMKGGTTAVEDVIGYAETLKTRGLNIMQGPGNDPESITGMVASGATVICFSTGKGTTTGDAICPVIKITSNEDTFKRLIDDMDFDASRLLHQQTSVDILGEELLGEVIDVASGKKTSSEKWKQRQFQVWSAGKLSL